MSDLSNDVARQLHEQLLRHANPRAALQGKTFFKEPIQLVGVNAKTMRALARAAYRDVKGSASFADALAVCERLLPEPQLEVKITSLLFLACFGKQLDAEVFVAAQRWIESDYCSSWAVIDALCIDILGPLLQREPPHCPLTRPWRRSGNMWLRRAGMVALVKPVRRGLLVEEAYAAASLRLNDPEDLVQKAVGWLLRETGKSDMGRLQHFLETHGVGCSRTTLRYAIERFPETTRQRLLQITKR